MLSVVVLVTRLSIVPSSKTSSDDKWQVRPDEMAGVEGTDRPAIEPLVVPTGMPARVRLHFSVFQLSSRRPNDPIKSNQTMFKAIGLFWSSVVARSRLL